MISMKFPAAVCLQLASRLGEIGIAVHNTNGDITEKLRDKYRLERNGVNGFICGPNGDDCRLYTELAGALSTVVDAKNVYEELANLFGRFDNSQPTTPSSEVIPVDRKLFINITPGLLRVYDRNVANISEAINLLRSALCNIERIDALYVQLINLTGKPSEDVRACMNAVDLLGRFYAHEVPEEMANWDEQGYQIAVYSEWYDIAYAHNHKCDKIIDELRLAVEHQIAAAALFISNLEC